MRKAKQVQAVACAVAAALTLSQTASATLILQDGFDYPSPGNLPGQTNPYENKTWSLTGTQTLSGPTIVSGNLSYPVSNPPSQLRRSQQH